MLIETPTLPSPFNANRVRLDFPIFSSPVDGKPLVYLDSAATTQKPQIVIDAICKYYKEECGTVHRAVYDLAEKGTEKYWAVREKVRSFLGGSSDGEIVFTSGTTSGLNLIALTAGEQWVSRGDEVIISEMEHHSNLIPWQLLCKKKKAKLRIVPVDDSGELIEEVYDRYLCSRTKIVSFTHMSNVTGAINPVERLTEKAHRVGAKVVIDGAQAAAQLPLEIQAFDPDFYLFSGHKVYGPTGVGMIYAKREHLTALHPVFGGSDMVEEVTLESASWQDPPLKFEPGTPPIASVIGLGSALDYVTKIGKKEIFLWEQELTRYALQSLQRFDGLRIAGSPKKRGGVVSFASSSIHPLDLASMLNAKGIAVRSGHLCAFPLVSRLSFSSLNRISFGMYTTIEDIDRLVDALQEIFSLIGSS